MRATVVDNAAAVPSAAASSIPQGDVVLQADTRAVRVKVGTTWKVLAGEDDVGDVERASETTPTAGAPASGVYNFQVQVADGNGDPVPHALVLVAWKGAAATLTPTLAGGSEVGSAILAGLGALSGLALFMAGDGGGLSFVMTGTAANTPTVSVLALLTGSGVYSAQVTLP